MINVSGTNNTIEKHQSALIILTAHGAKFSNISVEYHLGQIQGLLPSHPNPFIKVAPNLDDIIKVLSKSGNIKQ